MSVTPAFRRLLLLSQLLVLPLAALAQNVSVAIDAAQTVRIVDERVFGANSVIWDAQASSDQTISMLQAAGLRTIRCPGGSLSDEYHWRVNKTLANTWTWSTSFNGFTKLIANLNAQAFVTVNYGTGTPEEAAALVAYLNSDVGSSVDIGTDSKGYNWGNSGTWAAVRASTSPADEMGHLRIGRSSPIGAKYFEIGNECYGTWETDQQAVTHDPTTYANRAAQYMAKMRAVDSSIKIGVVVVTSGENASYKNWTPTMLARLKVLNAIPDFIIYHRYPQAPAKDQPGNPENDATLLQNAATWANTATDLRNQLNTYLGGSAGGVEVVVTENNSVYSNPGKQSTSLVNGLYLADSIANVMKTEINGFMWWAIRNGPPTTSTTNQSASLYGWRQYGDYGMISTPYSEGATTYASDYYTPHPTYYAMKLLQRFARGGDTVVSATSGSNLLSVFAAKRGDGSLTLLVLNKDPSNALTANISLAGFSPGATATVYSYGKPQDDAAKPGGSGSTDIATSTMNIAGATFSASFASYSATVISLAAPPSTTAPSFTIHPSSQGVVVGGSVTFTVAASGNPAPTYQWRKNGADIGGATGSSFTIASVSAADAATYVVVATNSQGSATSNPATLTVAPTRPTLFDAAGYLAHNADVAATIGDVPDKFDQAWGHYYLYGIREGRTDGDFDVGAYMAQYPAVGSDPQAAALYWYTTGRRNGDRVPAGFDIAGYLARNLDIYALFANDKYGAWLHFFNYGMDEGRTFDANFIVDEYLELNPDVKAAFGADRKMALLHWFQYGHPIEDRMGRVPIGFNVDKYLARYPDLDAVLGGITPLAVRNVTTWHHYLAYGVLESRSDGDFEANDYLASNPDLAPFFGTDLRGAALHWFFYGRREGRRIPAAFDVHNYRALYPDLVIVYGDDLYGCWLHYLDYGLAEGRVFDNLFRVDEYLALNPDIASLVGGDREAALMYWLRFGKAAGQRGRF